MIEWPEYRSVSTVRYDSWLSVAASHKGRQALQDSAVFHSEC